MAGEEPAAAQPGSSSDRKAWTVLVAGLVVVGFGLLLVLAGTDKQRAFIYPDFALGSTFVGWGMGIKVNVSRMLGGPFNTAPR